MTYITIFGLAVQTICLAVLWHYFRGKVFQYTGALFLLVIFVYHGILAEVPSVIFPGRNYYRDVASVESIGQTVWWFSAAMAVFLVCYLPGFNKGVAPFRLRQRAVEKANAILFSNRLVLLFFTGASYVISFYFSLSSSFDNIDVSTEYWIYGLAVSSLPYLLMLTVLTMIAFYRKLSMEVVLMLQLLINITAVARSAVLFSFIITGIMLVALGRSFDRRRMTGLVLVCLTALVFISISRGVFGRDELIGMSPWERFSSVVSSPKVSEGLTGEYLLDDFVARFDGNASNALVMESLSEGYEPAGIAPITIDLFLQLPRALNPQKLETDVFARNSEAFVFNYYGHDPTIDYTLGWWGYFLSCFGVYGLLMSAAVLGLMFSFFDRWLVATSSGMCVPLYYIAVFNVVYYEGTLPFFLGSVRTLAPILAAMIVIHFLVKSMCFVRIKAA